MKKLLFSALLIFTSLQAYCQGNWYNVHMSFTNYTVIDCPGIVAEIYFVADTAGGIWQQVALPADSTVYSYTDINGVVVDEFNPYINTITCDMHIPADSTVFIVVGIYGIGFGCKCFYNSLWTPSVSQDSTVQELVLDLYNYGDPESLWLDCAGDVNELSMTQIQVYPNPAKNSITLNSPLSNGFVKIYSESGQMVIHKRFFSNTFDLDISSLSQGSYFIELFYSEGSYTGRFMK